MEDFDIKNLSDYDLRLLDMDHGIPDTNNETLKLFR